MFRFESALAGRNLGRTQLSESDSVTLPGLGSEISEMKDDLRPHIPANADTQHPGEMHGTCDADVKNASSFRTIKGYKVKRRVKQHVWD